MSLKLPRLPEKWALTTNSRARKPASPGTPERMSAVHVEVGHADRVRDRARARGCATEDDGFVLCGVRLVPHTAGDAAGG